MTRCTGSASAKAILFGEHAVLYGCRAVAFPIPLYTVVTIEAKQDEKIAFNEQEITLADFEAWSATSSKFDRLVMLFKKILSFIEREKWSIDVSISSNIPMGAGLGSSSSLCVAALKSVFQYANISSISFDETLEIAKSLDDMFHYKSSGLDTSTILYQEPIIFQMSKCTPVDLKRFRFLIVDCNVERRTGSTLRYKIDEKCRVIFSEIGQITNDFNNDISHELLGLLIQKNQSLLTQLKVSHPAVDKFVSFMQSHLKISAKLTGAGCGGCILVLLPVKFQNGYHLNIFYSIETKYQ